MKKKNIQLVSRVSKIDRIIKLISKNFELKQYEDHYTDFGKCWLHKENGSYLTNEGLEMDLSFLLKYDIDELFSHSLGFSTKNQKYYGWSHRAIYGFKIGDKVKIGDSGYCPDNKDTFEESIFNWVSFDVGVDTKYGINCIIKSITKDTSNPDGYYTYSEKDVTNDQLQIKNQNTTDACKAVQTEETYHDPDPKILGINIITRTEFFGKQEGRKAYNRNHWYEYPETYGRGEYTITNIEEAKQAAIDFASSVS